MPLVQIKLIEGYLSRLGLPEEQVKKEILEKVTDVITSAIGEFVRPIVWVMIEDVKVNHWAIAGRPMPDADFLSSTYVEYVNELARVLKEYSSSGGT